MAVLLVGLELAKTKEKLFITSREASGNHKDNNMSERILVVQRADILKGLSDNKLYPTGDFSDNLEKIYHNEKWKGCLPPYHGRYLSVLLQRGFFIEREKAERDEELLQIIPYVIVRAGDKFLTYKRTSKSGESRLHNMYSIGVGGHVNTDDLVKALSKPPQGTSYAELAMLEGVERELQEEIHWSISAPILMLPGPLLYDGLNSVGRVHLGISVEMVLRESINLQGEEEEGLAQTEWKTLKQILELKDSLEGWSVIWSEYKKDLENKLCPMD